MPAWDIVNETLGDAVRRYVTTLPRTNGWFFNAEELGNWLMGKDKMDREGLQPFIEVFCDVLVDEGVLVKEFRHDRFYYTIIGGIPEAEKHVQFLGEPWPEGEECGWVGPGWYFWDETQANCHGPHPDKVAAILALHTYIKEVLG